MKNILVVLAICIIFFGCKPVEIKTPKFDAHIEIDNTKLTKCRVFLESREIGGVQVDLFECSSNTYFHSFGIDLYEGRGMKKEDYEHNHDGVRSNFPLDSTSFGEWGERVSTSVYACSFDENFYRNDEEVSYVTIYNVYDLYMDEDSIYVLKRKFKFDDTLDEEPKQDKPILLISASRRDVQSGLMREQNRIAKREHDKAEREAEEAAYARKKEEENTINGQQPKQGERIVKIEWNEELKGKLTRDSEDDFRFSSLGQRIPDGKIWILIYINEDYTYENGTIWSSVPYLFIDDEVVDWYSGRDFSEKSTIHLAKARDQNFRYYSGSSVKAISNMTHNEIRPNKLVGYKGYLWFLEVPE